MNTPTKLIAFAALVGLAFGGAMLAGAAVDPTDPEEAAVSSQPIEGGGHAQPGHGAAPERKAHAEHAAAGPAAGGLAVSEGGYTLEPDRTAFEAGRPARFSFRVTDPRGRTLRDEFETEHERELHLIVVRRDTAIYRHLHPRKADDGTWSVELELPEPGTYRAYADFKLEGESHTLATELFAPGDFRPRQLPEPTSTDAVAGYDVELRDGGAKAGREGRLTFAVTRDGRPAGNLEDYLGAKGHLVALREGDLAYLHVHPEEVGGRGEAAAGERHGPAGGHGHPDDPDRDGGAGATGEVPFAATFPSAGRYRLFFQFKADGEIRTVAYTIAVPR